MRPRHRRGLDRRRHRDRGNRREDPRRRGRGTALRGTRHRRPPGRPPGPPGRPRPAAPPGPGRCRAGRHRAGVRAGRHAAGAGARSALAGRRARARRGRPRKRTPDAAHRHRAAGPAAGRAAGRGAGVEENGLLPTRGARGAGFGPAGRSRTGSLRRGRGRGGGRGRRCGRGPRTRGRAVVLRRGGSPGSPQVPRGPDAAPRTGVGGPRVQPMPAGSGSAAAGLGAHRAWGRGVPAPGLGAPGDGALAAGAPPFSLRRAVGLAAVGRERLAQTTRDGGLHRRRRRFHELALLAQTSEYFLAGDNRVLWPNSCTRALPATALLTGEAERAARYGLDYVRNVLIVGTSRCAHVFWLPVLSWAGCPRPSPPPSVAVVPRGLRAARRSRLREPTRPRARRASAVRGRRPCRRTADRRHPRSGWSQAPRPARTDARSSVTVGRRTRTSDQRTPPRRTE